MPVTLLCSRLLQRSDRKAIGAWERGESLKRGGEGEEGKEGKEDEKVRALRKTARSK